MNIVRMENCTLLRCGGQQHDGMTYLVNGRELHTLVAHAVRTATQHIIYLDTTHEGVGGEVGLELTIGGTSCQIAHTHNLGLESVKGNSIKDKTLSHILRIDILITKILTHIEALLRKYIIFYLTDPQTTGAGCRNMNEGGSCLDAEVNTSLCTTDVYIFNLRPLREVFYDGSTVNYG